MCLFVMWLYVVFCFFFFKQKTAYEMRISDWSSDVCSSDLFSKPDAVSLNTPPPVKVRLYGRPERATKLTAKRVDRSSKNSSRKPSRVVILCLLLKKLRDAAGF